MAEEKTIYFTITQASDLMHVTKGAVYAAIRQSRLEAQKVKGHWQITDKEIDRYRLNKFNRDNRKHNGEQIYNLDAGVLSIRQAKLILNHYLGKSYTNSKIYYMLNEGKIKGYRKGNAWCVKVSDLDVFIINETDKEQLSLRQLKFA